MQWCAQVCVCLWCTCGGELLLLTHACCVSYFSRCDRNPSRNSLGEEGLLPVAGKPGQGLSALVEAWGGGPLCPLCLCRQEPTALDPEASITFKGLTY